MKKVMKIQGMMCQHCVAHATKALLAVDGVDGVEVSLQDGTATVVSAIELADETLAAAIVGAGYEVLGIETTK